MNSIDFLREGETQEKDDKSPRRRASVGKTLGFIGASVLLQLLSSGCTTTAIESNKPEETDAGEENGRRPRPDPACPLVDEYGKELDTDGDGTPDCEELRGCEFIPNPTQSDKDRDGVCDEADNAPEVTNPDQRDTDGDRVGDVADNCPLLVNPEQVDDDGDGAGAGCDCDDKAAGIHGSAPRSPAVPDTSCDGVDQDCDGKDAAGDCECTDGQERDVGAAGGECQQGKEECADGQWTTKTSAKGPTQETCNGLDDDCDGETDEGVCAGEGEGEGIPGEGEGEGIAGEGEGAGEGQEGLCNGIDDDGDGETDEGFHIGERCAVVDTCAEGELVCPYQDPNQNRILSCSPLVAGQEKKPEICDNGIDDDCDGAVDANDAECSEVPVDY